MIKTIPKIACLCGSTRQRLHFTILNRRLTLEGYIVLAPGVFGHDGDVMSEDQKKDLDQLHFHKIDLADEVHIIQKPNGSLGDSTKKELDYAKRMGKKVIFHRLSITPDDDKVNR